MRELLVVGVCVVVLTGCGAQKVEPAGLTASPTASVAPSPTPSPTPTEVTATDLSDPDGLGIVFVDTPDLTGPAASAHDAVAIFQQEYWRSWKEAAVSPLLTQTASPALVDKVDFQVRHNTEKGYGYDGIMRITISDVVVEGATASAAVCSDYADVMFTYLDGRPAEDLAASGLSQYELTTFSLSTVDGGLTWRPEDYVFEGEAC